jgi:hypothetical protein
MNHEGKARKVEAMSWFSVQGFVCEAMSWFSVQGFVATNLTNRVVILHDIICFRFPLSCCENFDRHSVIFIAKVAFLLGRLC